MNALNEVYLAGITAFIAGLAYYLIWRIKSLETKIDEKLSTQNCAQCNLRVITQQIQDMLSKLEDLFISHNHTDKGIVIRRE
jgi:uncharacterized protein YoxC